MDSRFINLPDEVSVGELESLINSLYLAVDDSTFSDAQKILLKTILIEGIIADNTNNFQAMTPKAFYNSTMTTVRLGIARLSTSAEVTAKSSIGILRSADQALMQSQWFKDWFISNGSIKSWQADNIDMNLAQAIAYNGVWSGAFSAGQLLELQPPGISTRTDLGFLQVYCTISLSVTGLSYHGSFRILSSTSPGTTLVPIGTSGFNIALTQNGSSFGIQTPAARTDVRISISVNGTFR